MLEELRKALRKFIGSTKSYERAVDDFIRDLQRVLIRADVNVRVVFNLSKKIRERALKEEPPPGVLRRDWFIKIVYEELTKLFGGEKEPKIDIEKKPYVLMLVGIQGSGKTTSAAKLALFYKRKGYRVGLICADTFRPAAYEQLKQLGSKIGVEVYGNPEIKDSIKLALEGVKYFKSKGYDLIIIDTAGRHKEEKGLLEEMKKIAEKVKPNEIMLVLDATIGQQALPQAKAFHEATPVGSIMVAKLDGTAKGGGAISAVVATGAKIKFIGTGEDVREIEVFNPPSFVSRILGLGDIKGLVERIRQIEEREELEKRQMKILATGKITMRDIYQQIKALRKMGPLSKIIQLIPGMGLTLPLDSQQIKLTEEKMEKWLAIIQSMTYDELEKPEKIDKSRIKRIAIGSGTSVDDVKELLTYYKMMNKMLKQFKRRKGVFRHLLKFQ